MGTPRRNRTMGGVLRPEGRSDSTRIVFMHVGEAIWILRADGSASWPVTRPATGAYHFRPGWSPDGGRIVFECQSPSHANRQLYEINTDGTGQRRISFNNGNDEMPDWGSSSLPLPAPPMSGVPDDCEAPPSATTTTYTGDASGQYLNRPGNRGDPGDWVSSGRGGLL